MNRIRWFLLACLPMATLMPFAGWCEVPLLINYRGYVDVSDPIIGLSTGAITVDLTFSLFDTIQIAGVTPLWSETQTVQLLDGNFAVMLGSVNPLSLGLFASSQRYLGVTMSGFELISPQLILSVPYAMQAGNVYSADNGRVGIGTTSPGATLDVQGNIRAANDIAAYGNVIGNANATVAGNASVGGTLTSDSLTAGSVTANGLIHSTSGGFQFPDGTVIETVPTISGYSLDAADGDPEMALYVDNEGKVGIGTFSPSKDLQVAGEAIVDETLTVNQALAGILSSYGWKIQTLPAGWNGLAMPYGGLGIGMEGNQDGAFGRMLILSIGSDAHADHFPTLMYAQRNYGGAWDTPLVIRRDGKVTLGSFPSANYDSGWFAVNAFNTYTVTHNLNLSDMPSNIQMFVSNVQSPVLGVDQIYLLNQAQYYYSGCGMGAYIRIVDGNRIEILTGINYVFYAYTAGNPRGMHLTTGYYRVKIWK